MANEIRLRQNFLGGLIEDNPLTSGATTFTSASLAAAIAVTSTSHLPIVLDPDGVFGEPEIAYVTAHTTAATTATILRGQEGSTARAHNRDTPWLHGATITDFALAGTMLPAWTAATLVNSWANTGSGYAPAGYYLGPDGVVHLRGLIRTGTAVSTAFTLPSGFRPEFLLDFATSGNATAVNIIEIAATGTVQVVAKAATDVSLEGISFRQFG